MAHLDPPSMYALRQSSKVFVRLFSDNLFRRYHGHTRLATICTYFPMDSLTVREREETARCLQRDMYCKSCLATRHGPDWDTRLAALQEELFCQGCKTHHPRFLFFPESIEDHKRGVGRLLCVGRLGRVTLCSHSTSRTTTTWQTIESNAGVCDNTVCMHPSHLSSTGAKSRKGLSAFPRLSLFKTCSIAKCVLAYGWDLPVLDIDQLNLPSLEAIREALIRRVEQGFNNHALCKHISRGGYLRSFVLSSICPCFSLPGRYLHPFSKDSRHDCFCQRQRYLNCKDCGAMYAWFLDAGHVVLMHRYIWPIRKPTSAAWLAFLDENSYRGRLFGMDTRHVLWCDNPQCAVGNGRRWESMVKANMSKECSHWDSDYGIAKQRFEETGYRMPFLRV